MYCTHHLVTKKSVTYVHNGFDINLKNDFRSDFWLIIFQTFYLYLYVTKPNGPFILRKKVCICVVLDGGSVKHLIIIATYVL